MDKTIKVGMGMSASFCSLDQALLAYEKLSNTELVPILSQTLFEQSSRFMTKQQLKDRIKSITPHPIITTIHESELLGPKNPLDVMVVLPCSANTLSKIANGICDNGLLMAIKATLRNQHPVVLGIYTNDGLGASFANIAKVMNRKNIFLVPLGQDDPINKENSLVCNPDYLQDVIECALLNKQYQPVIL